MSDEMQVCSISQQQKGERGVATHTAPPAHVRVHTNTHPHTQREKAKTWDRERLILGERKPASWSWTWPSLWSVHNLAPHVCSTGQPAADSHTSQEVLQSAAPQSSGRLRLQCWRLSLPISHGVTQSSPVGDSVLPWRPISPHFILTQWTTFLN